MQIKTIKFDNGRQFNVSDSGDISDATIHRIGGIYRICNRDHILSVAGWETLGFTCIDDGGIYFEPKKATWSGGVVTEEVIVMLCYGAKYVFVAKDIKEYVKLKSML